MDSITRVNTHGYPKTQATQRTTCHPAVDAGYPDIACVGEWDYWNA